ncbi:MAG: hypothetical protein JNL87_09030 [Burkholderiaceae bacterium]|nr:hypothetical protein [Burkholderiaceae bacterium]
MIGDCRIEDLPLACTPLVSTPFRHGERHLLDSVLANPCRWRRRSATRPA